MVCYDLAKPLRIPPEKHALNRRFGPVRHGHRARSHRISGTEKHALDFGKMFSHLSTFVEHVQIFRLVHSHRRRRLRGIKHLP